MMSFRLVLRLFGCLALPLVAAEWRTATVPGSWEESGPPEARGYDGFAWYRSWVWVPTSFLGSGGPSTIEGTVGLQVRDLADAHEAFVNGVRVGGAGGFPPEFRSAREEFHRHPVPAGTLRRDAWNEIALRVYNAAGPGGLLHEAPYLANRMVECLLQGVWEFRLGDGYPPGGPRSDRPATATFDAFQPATRIMQRAAVLTPGARLSPPESLALMRPADDLQVDLMLSEPLVAQPTHVSFDERGRLWVTQYRQYPYPAGVRIISRTSDFRSQYDRLPEPPPHHTRGADVISIHEDTDGDGVFDRHKVFQDGLNMANSAVRARGGVWVLSPPHLLFYPDRDFDDVPDGPPEVHLRGFGLEDTHSVANGLVWGPDGWLYGAHGNTSASRITRPGLDPPDAPGAYTEGSMVWRYHPGQRVYEIFASGSGNLFGVSFDDEGRLYGGQNGGKTHGWHFVQGGYYRRQTIDPRNPFAFGDLPPMETANEVPRFSHFGAYVGGTALPPAYRGRLLALNPLLHEIITVERGRNGSTFATVDIGRALRSEDPAFRPVYIANAPDGAVFFADFYDYYVGHGQHYQSQIDPSTGRVYRLRGRDAPLERNFDLSARSTPQLLALLAHANQWHRLTAVRLLGERHDPSALPELRRTVLQTEGPAALAALWALQQGDALDPATMVQALDHPMPAVRRWAVRLVGDRFGINRSPGLPSLGAPSTPALPEELASALFGRARREQEPEIRLQLAATARRLPTVPALDLLGALTARPDEPEDAFLPLFVWWVLEAHLREDPDAVLAFFQQPEVWSHPLIEHEVLARLMRRFALQGRRSDFEICARLLRAAPAPAHVSRLLEGFVAAFRGRPIPALPETLARALDESGQLPLLLRVRKGEPAAVREALLSVRDEQVDQDERVGLVRALGELRSDEARPLLLDLAVSERPIPMRKAALAALAAYDDADLGPWTTEFVLRAKGELRAAGLALAVARPAWMEPLVAAIEDGRLPVRDVPPEIAARLRDSSDAALAARAAKALPPPAFTRTGDARDATAITSILRAGAGSPYEGRPIYQQLCGSCHTLFQEGGRLGPDLTGYQRDNLAALLPAILEPNAEVREGFHYSILQTKDGRSLGGFLLERDGRVVVLRGLDGEDVTIPESEVLGVQPVGRSLMPEGLLNGLEDQQLRDLFAYLRLARSIF